MAKQLYMYTKMSADKFAPGGWNRETLISDSYDTLSAERDKALAQVQPDGPAKPNAHVISTITIEPMRELQVLKALGYESSQDMRAHTGVITPVPAGMPSGSIITHSYDAYLERDYFHDQSMQLSGNVGTAIKSLMEVRGPALEAMQLAAARTHTFSHPGDLTNPEIHDAMRMAYTGVGRTQPNLEYALNEMARNDLGTAAHCLKFQQQYEKQLTQLGEQHPEWGPNQLHNEAAVATAVYFQKNMCGVDLRQQYFYAGIAQEYQNARPQALAADNQLRAEQPQVQAAALSYAQDQTSNYLQNFGLHLSGGDIKFFTQDVMNRVTADSQTLGFNPQKGVQSTIHAVASEWAEAADKAGNKVAGYEFRNIANEAKDAADAMDDRANNGPEEVSIDD